MREPMVVVCTLVRDSPEAVGPARREFCSECKSRVWLSLSSVEAAAGLDRRAQAMCVACARCLMTPEDEAAFLEDACEQVALAARALGVDPARAVAAYLDDWRGA